MLNDAPLLLVVDDESTNLQLMRRVLGEDYRLLFAKDGERAIALAKEEIPDLILLDVMMPGMTGHDTCRLLKSDPVTAPIPVIFVTALTDPVDEVVGFEAGAVDYIMKPISSPILRARVRNQLSLVHLDELRRSRLELVQRLGRAAEYKDTETGYHVVRMSHYAAHLAAALGKPGEWVDNLLAAAPMHDVGKIGIPDQILTKPAKLSPEEWMVMKSHPVIGAEIIGKHDDSMLRMAYAAALTHHEKWDGSGYPSGLAGEEIPLEGRLVAVADVFDALTSPRPYKRAWSNEEAADLIKSEAGRQFDPVVVKVFLDSLPDLLVIQARYKD